MVEEFEITIPSLTKDKIRRVFVYLPVSYSSSKTKRYPVLYMFDGHNVFFDEDATYGKSWGMNDYLDSVEAEMIVVGVECNSFTANGRIIEYSPFDYKDYHFGFIKGKGRTYMNWLTRTLKPLIDDEYRTIPERECTFIGGSSMGGLMSLYAITAYNKYFSKACALSPSIWTNYQEIKKFFTNYRISKDTEIFMNYGSNEFENHKGIQNKYIDLTSLIMKNNIFLTSRVVPYGEHCEAEWELEVPLFIDFLMR